MKTIKLLLLVIFAGTGALQAQSDYNDFIPVGPLPIDYKTNDGRLISEISESESENEKVINLLPNELKQKSVVKIDKKGNIELSPLELSEKGVTYVVKTDYIKYTTLPVRKDAPTGEIVGMARVGVGARIEITLTSLANGLNVADIYQVGAQAAAGKVKGNIVMSFMGVEAEAVTSLFPVNAEITPTSVAAALQSMEKVKTAIYDGGAHLTPQVLEIKYTSEYLDANSSVMDLMMPILLNNKGEAVVVIR